MYPIVFYEQMLYMGFLVSFYHGILQEKNIFEKYSVNMMRSTVCFSIFYQSLIIFPNVWQDKNLRKVDRLDDLYYSFLSYFLFDTVILFYQVYKGYEKRLRQDLLIHHLLAITALFFIQYYRVPEFIPFIGMSEGMSIVSGPKLIAMKYGNKLLTNGFIYYRLLFLVFFRMIFLWPTLFIYSLFLPENHPWIVFGMLSVIYHSEIQWLNSGRGELARI